ncbi:MAG: 23S rRNA (adenine(2503)-C(2))-methyltransferase RlmN [Thermoanaerobaculia bacterium]
MDSRRLLLDLDSVELEAWLADLGEPRFRAQQILYWTYRRPVDDFESMTDLPHSLKVRLGSSFDLRSGRVLARASAADGAVKLLLSWPDAATTECVMIPALAGQARRTACISTQVGCDVGCRFCASGIDGALRNLTVGEVVEQAVVVAAWLRSRQERLSHVVFMGMGEPLANYEVTVEAVRRLNAPWGLGISQRRITVSTVGLPKQIERLAEEDLQITLALSLHAPNEELRRQLIPWARGVPLSRLLEACRHYFSRTGREMTLEYCLLAEVNDQAGHARQLAEIACELRAHVNLLMYNPVSSLPFARPSRNRAVGFLKELRRLGVNAHLRESRGLEADAACGQLQQRH